MKYFLPILLFFGTVLLIVGCKPNINPERQKIYDEVMAIHDEVMPEMKTINTLERSLKKKISTIGSQDSLIMMKATLKRLEEADQLMMNWMHELDVPSKDVPDDVAIAYLKKEKNKITSVSTKMKKAIESGKAIVKKF